MVLISILCVVNLAGCSTLQSLYKKDAAPASKSAPIETLLTAKTPLQQVLKSQSDLSIDQTNVSIKQVFNRIESPSAAQVTVIQSGLMDDSVAAIRTVYQFKKHNANWTLSKTEKSFQCQRGQNTKSFQTKLCP